MKKASNKAYLKRAREEPESSSLSMRMQEPKVETDLNIFVVTFDGMKESEKNLSGGDPYQCKKCHAILNRYSTIVSAKQYEDSKCPMKLEFKQHESLWKCEFCSYPNIISIEKEEVPKKDDVVYMLESALEGKVTENDETMVFCIDVSGSMNTTSEIKGKKDLKFGLSKEEIEMLKQFMEPGDEAQFNFLPGAHNKDKTFISRKQCILSAIENQLDTLKKVDPLKKVAFVTFNNEVTVQGDAKAVTVNILGDKLNKQEDIVNSLKDFKVTTPLSEAYEGLITSLNKTEPKGQTALGPALISAIQVASKGSPGSSVILCTDGLANIGIGAMDVEAELSRQFYESLAIIAKERNIVINIMTIKGEGCKLEIIGKLAEVTNGNVKVVNPEKLSDDFANVLKDEVVGLNVEAKVMLHKAMIFRNEDIALLRDNGTTYVKEYANATANTRMSFEYELRKEEDLKFMQIEIEKLKKVPFQAQIIYWSPKGGKFLRVISSQSETTEKKQELLHKANIGVVHQRVSSNATALFSRGRMEDSQAYGGQWNEYMKTNFNQGEQQKKQEIYLAKSTRLNEAMSNKCKKQARMEQKIENVIEEEEEMMPESNIISSKMASSKKPLLKKKRKASMCSVDSDEDEMEIKEHMLEKQGYDLD